MKLDYFLYLEVVFHAILDFLIFILLWSSGPEWGEAPRQHGTEMCAANKAQGNNSFDLPIQKGQILWEIPTAFTAAWLEEAVDTNLFQARLFLTHLDWEQGFQALNKKQSFWRHDCS